MQNIYILLSTDNKNILFNYMYHHYVIQHNKNIIYFKLQILNQKIHFQGYKSVEQKIMNHIW